MTRRLCNLIIIASVPFAAWLAASEPLFGWHQ